jgi:signal transduction histidine kinase
MAKEQRPAELRTVLEELAFQKEACRKLEEQLAAVINGRRTEAEQMLRASESNLNAIIENSDAFIYSIDRDFKYITFNSALKNRMKLHFGIDIAPGYPIFDYIDKVEPGRAREWVDIYTRALNGEIVKFEREFIVGDILNYTSFSIHPIWENENITGLSCFVNDITEKKLANMKLLELNKNLEKQARELASSNAELEQFAYVASHDLQEPLRMVSSFMSRLESKYGHVVDEKGRQYIHFALDGAKRMREIIRDLLEFSRIGSTGYDAEQVDINKLINELLPFFRRIIEEDHGRISFTALPMLQTYKTPVRQVFQNLIGNALTYHRASIPPVVSISCIETPLHYQFSVKDNGIGIEAKDFDKIFIIFQRLHNRDEYPGTGMGLAIAKKIIENLGGRIWLESEPGKGSTFYFTLLKNNEQ